MKSWLKGGLIGILVLVIGVFFFNPSLSNFIVIAVFLIFVGLLCFYSNRQDKKNRIWIDYGLDGMLIGVIISLIMVLQFNDVIHLVLLGFPFSLLNPALPFFLVIGIPINLFIVGSIIGLIIGRIKSGNKGSIKSGVKKK